jgi:hypothetical protein
MGSFMLQSFAPAHVRQHPTPGVGRIFVADLTLSLLPFRPSPGDCPTLIFISNFGPPAERRPGGGGLRCAEPAYFSRVAARGGRLFSRFGAHLCPAHVSRFDPAKYPTLVTTTPGCSPVTQQDPRPGTRLQRRFVQPYEKLVFQRNYIRINSH